MKKIKKYDPLIKQVEEMPELECEALPSIKPQIAPRTLRLLETESWEAYESQQHQDYAIVLGLVNSHYSDQQIEQIMLDYPTRFRRKHEVSRSAATGWLSRSLKKARSQEDSKETQSRRSKIREVSRLLPQIEFPNRRTTDTDRQLLKALLEVAYDVGSFEFRKDTRSLATMSLMALNTVSASLKRLSQAGWLTTHGFNDFGTKFKLALDVILEKSQDRYNNHSSLSGYCTQNDTPWEHEIFSPKRFGKGSKHSKGKGGLGRACGFIYQLLANSPMSFAELQQVSKESRATLYRCLNKMKEIVDSTGEVHSLVEEKNDKWLITNANLDELSRTLGTEGKRRRLKIIYQIERDQNRRRREIKQGL